MTDYINFTWNIFLLLVDYWINWGFKSWNVLKLFLDSAFNFKEFLFVLRGWYTCSMYCVTKVFSFHWLISFFKVLNNMILVNRQFLALHRNRIKSFLLLLLVHLKVADFENCWTWVGNNIRKTWEHVINHLLKFGEILAVCSF